MATATKPKNRLNGKADAQDVVHVQVQPLRTQTATFRLIGESPLVVHNFDEKSRREMLEGQTGKKKQAKKEARCPEHEFLQAFYWVDSEPPKPDSINDAGVPEYDEKRIAKILKTSKFGVPITGFKNAIISAARNTDMTMTSLRQQLFVTSPDHHEFAIIKGKPVMDSRIVRVGNKIPMERFRPMFPEWETTISIEFDSNMLNVAVVTNLLQIAGYYVGICEGRPEKSALGWGRWSIAE